MELSKKVKEKLEKEYNRWKKGYFNNRKLVNRGWDNLPILYVMGCKNNKIEDIICIVDKNSTGCNIWTETNDTLMAKALIKLSKKGLKIYGIVRIGEDSPRLDESGETYNLRDLVSELITDASTWYRLSKMKNIFLLNYGEEFRFIIPIIGRKIGLTEQLLKQLEYIK